jgi:CrcB protein
MAFAGTGFCGALSTYSTFGYETLRLAETGARSYAALNAAASIAAGLGAAYCGMVVAQALQG